MPPDPADEAWRRAEQGPHPGSTIPTPGGTYVPRDPDPGEPARDAGRFEQIARAASEAANDLRNRGYRPDVGRGVQPYIPQVESHPRPDTWRIFPTFPGPRPFVPRPYFPPPGNNWQRSGQGSRPAPRDPSKGLPLPPAHRDADGFFVLPKPPVVRDKAGFYAIALPPGAIRAVTDVLRGGGKEFGDETLISTFGNTEWTGDNKERGFDHPLLDTFDSLLEGSPALRAAIEDAARKVGIDPGLLAACALHEDTSGGSYTKPGAWSSKVGVDFWDTAQEGVKKRVPAAESIKSHRMTDAESARIGIPKEFKNEKDEVVGFNRVFERGSDATLAVAATLKSLETQLAARAGGGERWAAIPFAERYALVRWAYNAGPKDAFNAVRSAASGRSILKSSGPLYLRDSHGTIRLDKWGQPMHDPLRHATQAAGQAVHISEKFFQSVDPATASSFALSCVDHLPSLVVPLFGSITALGKIKNDRYQYSQPFGVLQHLDECPAA